MDKWIGKVAVVTGASAGIGKAIVKDLAKAGIHVVGLARRDEKIVEYVRELGNTSGKVYARKCDISDQQSVKQTFQWIEQQFGSISILINNAAILYNGTILDPGDDAMDQLNAVINTNFTGAVQCSREAIRLIEKSCDHGLVVNINSIAGNYVPFGMGTNVYAASKHALRAFSEVLRHELVVKKDSKIRVSNLSPGVVETEMAVAAGMVSDASLIYQHLPHLSSENVSESVMFLLQVPYNVNITQLTIQPVGEKA
ncbi:farnesol dehydrogenase-like [Bradysia coprophila]|uniref:farnesol dehydrogenase-like n=1 Tax=Bradysia coprophila TaxID=38358 RepID=UPI00187DA635|nr:farnesol dehydrogenase-like [Bradysia coprophila]